jgi:signal transduction histidine kinase
MTRRGHFGPSLGAVGIDRSRLQLRRLGGWPLDVTVALCVAAIDVYGAYEEAINPVQGDPDLKLPVVPAWAYVLVAVAGLALVGRRRWPVATFAVVMALTLAFTVLGYNDGAPLLAVAFSLYAVATGAPARTTWVCLGVSVVLMEVASDVFGPFSLTGGPALVIPWELAAGAGAGFAIANRRAYAAQMRERAEEAERSREEEARRRVDAERLRIARELHDVVAHSMATINVQAGVAVHFLRQQPEEVAKALSAVEAVRTTSKEALREMRGILNLLRSTDDKEPTAPVPRLSQLDELVAASTRAGLPTSVEVSGPVRELPPAVDLAAYRVVQESLTNTLRHAGPARARVRLAYRPDALVLEVSDNGQGRPPPVAGPADSLMGTAPVAGGPETGGNGLQGMRERAEAVGGRLDAGPGQAGGFLVRAVLPYAGPSEPAPVEPAPVNVK